MQRRNFLRSTGVSLASAGALGVAATGNARAETSRQGSPKGARILIRGGYILTQDPKLGQLRGDVLIDNGKIVAVGKGLEAGGVETVDASGMIVLPGFIETHRHTWQSCLRHMGGNWSAAQYFSYNFFKFGVNMRPEDVYAANLIGRLAALDGGITTLLDWSHIMNSPAHADAAVQGLRDTSARSVFAMGWPQAPAPGKWITSKDGKSIADIPDDIRRVRRSLLPGDSGLVTLAMAGRGPDFAVMDQVKRDLMIARDLGIRTTIHIGFAVPGGIAAMKAAGLLGPDITHVHVHDSTEEELQMIVDSGGTTSISPLDEMMRVRWRRTLPPVMSTLSKGLVVSLSVDSESTSDGSMFSIMRNTLAVGRIQASNPPDQRPEPADFSAAKIITTDMVLNMATIEGAKTLGQERRIGSISVGKDADLLLLRADDLSFFPLIEPDSAIVCAADKACVDTVFVAGKVLKFDGRLVDQPLVERARRLAVASRDYLFEKGGYKMPADL